MAWVAVERLPNDNLLPAHFARNYMFDFLRRWFEKKEQLTPVIDKPQDQALLRCMVNCRVKGTLTLPSGQVIPAAPPGKVWLVDRGEVTLVNDNG